MGGGAVGTALGIPMTPTAEFGDCARARIVLPLGLRRSGTSLLAEILHGLGVVMGERFCPLSPEWNPHGSYEDAEFVSVMDDLLRDTTLQDGYITNPSSVYEERLRAFIARRCASYRVWGVKNFGIMYCLQHFVQFCPCKVRIICMRRNFAAAVKSWMARTNEPLVKVVHRFSGDLYHLEEASRNYRGDKMEIHFDDLIGRPATVIGEVADFCGVPHCAELAGLVRSDLRRF
jgi:hypothetical protein